MKVDNFINLVVDFIGFNGYFPSRPNYVQEFYPSETLGERRWMGDEREKRRQEILTERKKPLTRRIMEAGPRYLEALKQRLFSTLFLTILVVIAFVPVLCVLSVFGGVGFFLTVGPILVIQTLSAVLFLMPFILCTLVAFLGICSTTMAIMVTIKCINAIIQRFIQAFLRVRDDFRECIQQLQAWYKEACRMLQDIYLSILRIIFFPFAFAEFIRCLVFNAFYTVFVHPLVWFVSLPFDMINGVMEVIWIILGEQKITRSHKSSLQDAHHPCVHRQPMNAPQLLLAAMDRVLPCEDRVVNDVIPDLAPDYSTWYDRYYDMIIHEDYVYTY